MISILSAWAMDTDIFLLDEPTANLDFAATEQLKEILLELKNQGKTILLSEHRLYYLADIADEFWVMADGEIKANYSSDDAKKLSEEEKRTLSLRTLDLNQVTVSEKHTAGTYAKALEVSDISYRYAKKTGDILSGVSFSVGEHETVGLGRRKRMRQDYDRKAASRGCTNRQAGRYRSLGKCQNPKQLQKQVMFIMQEAEFQFFTNSVHARAAIRSQGHAGIHEKRTEALLISMGMWECRDRHPFSLSGGQMQKLTLMMAYLSDKPIVILDEPTAGQDAAKS